MKNPIFNHYELLLAKGNLQKDTHQEELITRLDSLYENLHLPCWKQLFYKRQQGIYIVGEPGRGKTFWMDVFYEKVSLPKQRYHFYEFINLILSLNLKYNYAWPRTVEDILQRGKIICLDEFHLLDMGDAMMVYKVLHPFLTKGGVLVTTSNFKIKNHPYIHDEKVKPLLDLLQVYTEEVGVLGQRDFRQLYSGKEHTMELSGEENYSVYTFDDLYDKPLGVKDYQDILKNEKTIIITGFRKINTQGLNHLIRFIKFIDVAYERKCRIVIKSPKINVKDIYKESQYKALWERAYSRLNKLLI